jgi:hypothetical protein
MTFCGRRDDVDALASIFGDCRRVRRLFNHKYGFVPLRKWNHDYCHWFAGS